MKFYITTPIYYVNDQPHIGHAYTTVAADVLARYYRQRGHDVFFLTGTDEHGQKVERAASAKGLTPKEHADQMVENFRSLWAGIGISNDAFIRTTDDGHREVVRKLLMELWRKGEIERRSYKGWYCTPDERFWTAKDLAEGKCPDCGREVEEIEEENYFFLMSRYHDRLVRHIEEDPGYILPETRRNEVMGFLKAQPLGDLCISRPRKRLSWGIPLPFDEEYVTYVWFDALINYYSATKYLAPAGADAGWWPADVHIVGKDILTTHAVYWSTMLMALGLPLPKRIFAHGWWTIEGRKMSKSLGNVVAPGKMVDKYGVDAFRYFLFREVSFGLDGDFSEEALVKRINTELANDLGNLLSRTLTMIEKFNGGVIPQFREMPSDQRGPEIKPHFLGGAGDIGAAEMPTLDDNLEVWFPRFEFHKALNQFSHYINARGNKYIMDSAPWKEKDKLVLFNRLNDLAEFLRIIALYLYPFMPSSAQEIWRQLGIKESMEKIVAERGFENIVKWRGYPIDGLKVDKGKALFPRIEKTTETSGETAVETSKMDNLISIDDFAKVELKTGKILAAERVPKSEKLIRLEIDTGEVRQVVAGIGKAYAPEDLVGKTVVVVTNLKPAKLMGVESHGMVLAATAEGGQPVVLTVEKEVAPGARVK